MLKEKETLCWKKENFVERKIRQNHFKEKAKNMLKEEKILRKLK